MATQYNCVCGKSVNRTKGKRYHRAMNAIGSGRIKRVFGSTTQLCSNCLKGFINSRPDYDDPESSGTHILCDWCNAEMSTSLLRSLRTPTITRWKGKVPRWKGQTQCVCDECRTELSEFIEEKQNPKEENY